uniref:Uncharacterized protein n=1 Tax=Rousettus aegyptiacus TaxID=9407 RepID=A0A7J8FI70_ROUAE|nr:hypothetical protein HJG63_011904 [Rousettus aegyptiacus]
MERDGGQGQGLAEKRAQRRLKFGQEEHHCYPKPPSHRDGNTPSLSVGRPLSLGNFLLLSSLPEDAPSRGCPPPSGKKRWGFCLAAFSQRTGLLSPRPPPWNSDQQTFHLFATTRKTLSPGLGTK